MIEYVVVEASTAEELQRLIKNALLQGWSLQGGVSVGCSQGWRTYVQAVTKEQR